jgi:hypothetical protein
MEMTEQSQQIYGQIQKLGYLDRCVTTEIKIAIINLLQEDQKQELKGKKIVTIAQKYQANCVLRY